ncbi:EAL domain-containing protein [Mesorhizobium sp. M0062]|uniref:EAL domain-containing protein n=1 Tax=Mesorhizobium sp. M0062 TaxID=2956867 RepID=UPI0033388671
MAYEGLDQVWFRKGLGERLKLLVPILEPGDIIVLDDLGSHRARSSAAPPGEPVLFLLPNYLPDLNAVFARAKQARCARLQSNSDAFYQPILRLDTRAIVGVEALCRPRKPDGEIVSAGAFHQPTSDVSVASHLTERMMAIVAADARSWLHQGIPLQHVGINISSADFHSGTLYGRLEAAFGRENVPLKHIILEVTESVYLGQRDPIRRSPNAPATARLAWLWRATWR